MLAFLTVSTVKIVTYSSILLSGKFVLGGYLFKREYGEREINQYP